VSGVGRVTRDDLPPPPATRAATDNHAHFDFIDHLRPVSKGIDKIWFQNAVRQHLEESGIDFTEDWPR
jgi:hypothetical protein